MKIDSVVRSRRKTAAIYVYPDGRVEVRAPRRATRAQIEAFVKAKEAWILKKQAQAEQHRLSTRPKQFVEGELFLYLGQSYPLSILDGAAAGLRAAKGRPALCLEGGRFLLEGGVAPQAREVFEGWYREQARQVITARVKYFAAQHGFEYGKIRITGAKTRWGSCSSHGTLSFTWRLVMAPPAAVDYVVVHELAHQRVQNHSAAFWEVVAGLMPNYAQQRAWFRQHGQTLTLEGTAAT